MKTAFSFLLIFSIIVSCNQPQTNTSVTKELILLDDHDKKVCDSIGFDTLVLSKIRNHSDNLFSVFYRESYYVDDSVKDSLETKRLGLGLSFKATNEMAPTLVDLLSNDLFNLGYTIFISEQNFGIQDSPDQISVLKTKDKFDVLKFQRTDAANYGIDNDSLLQVLAVFDKKYSLKIDGAGPDWCQFEILQSPDNWMDLANEVYKVCPDVVSQGTETVEALADEMKRTKKLYFWWD